MKKAIEMAKIFGMLKYLPEGKLTHVPFSLSPYSINEKVLDEMLELNPYFSELMIRVSQDWNFLEETLTPISKIIRFKLGYFSSNAISTIAPGFASNCALPAGGTT